VDSDLAAVERRERGVELSGFLAGPFGRYIMMAISVALVAVSASIHEFAHGWMALRCGDPTAKEAGRLTLNPLAHLDPFGSFMLPLMMALAGMPVFAAAKPVPFNPRRLRNPARDEALVALAGPVSNIIQAIVAAVLLYLEITFLEPLALRDRFNEGFGYDIFYLLVLITNSYLYVNLSLAFFNLIPIPPLDGSKLISPLLKGESRRIYNMLQAYSLPILMIVLYVVPTVFRVDPLGWYFDLTVDNVYDLLTFWW
jgi:Zn-dependent protease